MRHATSLVELARQEVGAVILDDANDPSVERGAYVIGYCEAVDGYRHAYGAPVGKHRTVVRYSHDANHPADPRCPGCHPEAGTESVVPNGAALSKEDA